ncbi:MAG: hypothetical protein KA035_02030 [Candidatus Levybacteria bacterium]|nr:hypothetical protein [Candidatus Levybacteria bacterium]
MILAEHTIKVHGRKNIHLGLKIPDTVQTCEDADSVRIAFWRYMNSHTPAYAMSKLDATVLSATLRVKTLLYLVEIYLAAHPWVAKLDVVKVRNVHSSVVY